MNMFATTSRVSFLLLCLVGRVISDAPVEASSTAAAAAAVVCEKKAPVDKWFLATFQGRYDDFQDDDLALVESIFLDEMDGTGTADGDGDSACFQLIEKVSVFALDPEDTLNGGSAKLQEQSDASGGLRHKFMISIQAQGFQCGDCDESISVEDMNFGRDMEMETLLKEKVNLAFLLANKGRASESGESASGEEKTNMATMVDLEQVPFAIVVWKIQDTRDLQEEACGEVTLFVYRVIVELNQTCSADFSTGDKARLGEAYVDSFNVTAASFCDPFDRQVETATIVKEGVLSANGTLGIELEVNGTFRCPDSAPSCDIAEIGLYDVPSLELGVTGLRYLQEEDNCTCPIDATADRGVYESEVIDAFRTLLTSLAPTLDCQQLSVTECEFGTIFESKIQVTFANATLAQSKVVDIEAGALETLNAIFNPEDPNTCNPEFRKFSNIRVVFGERSNRGLELMPEGRLLQADTNSTSPSSSPSASPTDSLPLVAFLSTSGICSGCTNDLFLSNQVSGRNLARFQEARMSKVQGQRPPRELQEAGATSNCFCAVNATNFVTLPAIEDFATGLEERTQLEIADTLQIPNDAGIYSYSCTNSGSVFTKNITLELQYTCSTTPDFSDEIKVQIATAYLQAYNGLKSTVCDQFERTINSARIVQVGELRGIENSIPLVVEVEMVCFGCDTTVEVDAYGFPNEISTDADALGGFARRGLEQTRVQHRMEEETTCTCPASLPRRAPLEADVTDAVDPVLQSLALTCVGNTTTCDFGANFATNVLLEVQLDDSLDVEATALILQSAYITALGNVVGGGNDTQCNRVFGSVLDSNFSLNFVYNSLERGSNQTEEEPDTDLRRLQDQQVEELLFNNSESPSSAPTSTFVAPSTVFVLLSASGVCNGCPSDLFFGNQVNNRRKTMEESSTSPNMRLLEDVFTGANSSEAGDPAAESDCYCPIGSTEVAYVFDQAVFTELLQKEVSKVSNTTQLSGSSYGVSQVECSRPETTFETTIQFEFSAFQWVMNNEQDVQGLGNEIATAYNNLVVTFCDDYFRNSVSLTYNPGTVRPTDSGAGRSRRHHARELQQEGCFNYVAEFTVQGICRGCEALGTQIPLFGGSDIVTTSTTGGRKLDLLDSKMDEMRRYQSSNNIASRSRPASFVPQHRRLETSTCICDAGAVAQKSAPSFEAVQAELQSIIPAILPWAAYPSICGLPVANEVQCSEMPNGSLETFIVSLFVRRRDGACLGIADLTKLAADYEDIYNTQKREAFFPCEPDYVQISTVEFDETIVNDCLRRREMMEVRDENDAAHPHDPHGRSLATDHIQVDLTVTASQTDLSEGDASTKVVSDTALVTTVIRERNIDLDEVLLDASPSPSAIPSSEPSDFPSSFPSEFPTSDNCFQNSFQIEDGEDGDLEEDLFSFEIPDELDTCGEKEDEGVVFEWDDADKNAVFVSVEFGDEVPESSTFVVYEFDDPGICSNWECDGAQENIVCTNGCCNQVERTGKLPNIGVIGYNTDELPLRVILSEDPTTCFPAEEIQALTTESPTAFQTVQSTAQTCGLGLDELLPKSAFYWDGNTDGRILVQPAVSNVCDTVQLWAVDSVDSNCFDFELLATSEVQGPTSFDLTLYAGTGPFMVVISGSTACEGLISSGPNICFPPEEIQAITQSPTSFQTIESTAETFQLGLDAILPKGAFYWDGSTDGRILVKPDVSNVCDTVQLWAVDSVDSKCFDFELLATFSEVQGPSTSFDLTLDAGTGPFMVVISGSTACEGLISFGPPVCSDESGGGFPLTEWTPFPGNLIANNNFDAWYGPCLNPCLNDGSTHFVTYEVPAGESVYIEFLPGSGVPGFDLSVIPYDDPEAACMDLVTCDGETIGVPSSTFCYEDFAGSFGCDCVLDISVTSLVTLTSSESFYYRLHTGDAPCFDDIGYRYEAGIEKDCTLENGGCEFDFENHGWNPYIFLEDLFPSLPDTCDAQTLYSDYHDAWEMMFVCEGCGGSKGGVVVIERLDDGPTLFIDFYSVAAFNDGAAFCSEFVSEDINYDSVSSDRPAIINLSGTANSNSDIIVGVYSYDEAVESARLKITYHPYGGVCSDESEGDFPVTEWTSFPGNSITSSDFVALHGTCDGVSTHTHFVMYEVPAGESLWIEFLPDSYSSFGTGYGAKVSRVPYAGEACMDLYTQDACDSIYLHDLSCFEDGGVVFCGGCIDILEASLVTITSSDSFEYRLHTGDAPCFDDRGYLYESGIEECQESGCVFAFEDHNYNWLLTKPDPNPNECPYRRRSLSSDGRTSLSDDHSENRHRLLCGGAAGTMAFLCEGCGGSTGVRIELSAAGTLGYETHSVSTFSEAETSCFDFFLDSGFSGVFSPINADLSGTPNGHDIMIIVFLSFEAGVTLTYFPSGKDFP